MTKQHYKRSRRNKDDDDCKLIDLMDEIKELKKEIESLKEEVEQKDEEIKEKKEELATLKEKQDLPTNIDTDTKSEKSNSTSNITNPSVDTHPVFLHLTKHKAQLEKSIKQLVNKKIFSAAKFPLSKDHSKILLIKAVNDQTIILPTPVTAEEFGEFMWIDVSKNINNNRHKTQTLMRKHFTGTFLFVVVCSYCFLLFIISNIFLLSR